MTGADSPTNPIGPARVTAAALRSTATSMVVIRVRRTSRPRTAAPSSPRARRSSRRASSMSTATATRTTGATRLAASRLAWPSVPLPHAYRPAVSCWKRIISSVVPAMTASATAEPARTRRIGAPPPIPITNAAATRPPAKATPPNPSTPRASPNTEHRVTANQAPALTASVSGDASGLRLVACIAAPAAPSAIPTTTPLTRRGSRPPSRTSSAAGSAPNSARTMSHGPTAEVPWVRWTRLRTTAATTATSTTPAAVSRRPRWPVRSPPPLQGRWRRRDAGRRGSSGRVPAPAAQAPVIRATSTPTNCSADAGPP